MKKKTEKDYDALYIQWLNDRGDYIEASEEYHACLAEYDRVIAAKEVNSYKSAGDNINAIIEKLEQEFERNNPVERKGIMAEILFYM